MEGASLGGPSRAPEGPPATEIEKQYVFNTSLLQLQLEGPFISGSDPPCDHCRSKRIKCICEAVKEIGRAPAYDSHELFEIRERLERSRAALSAIPIDEWKRHTSKTDLLKQVIPTIKQKVHDGQGHFPELLINSWTKLYEILAKSSVLKPKLQQQEQERQQQRQPRVIKSIHLCECPGGFVAATNHFIKTQAQGVLHSWRATSLNPYFEGCIPMETLDDDGLYRHTERRWLTSPDGSGDLRSRSSIEFIWRRINRPVQHGVPPFGLADLVTSDGSFDVQHDPEHQEDLIASLVYAEVVTTLGLLQLHSSAVIKAYALHTHHSVSVLAILSMCFKTVAVVKPLMSRGGNSEVYLLGIDFRGVRSPLLRALSAAVDSFETNRAIIPKQWLPDAFVAECRRCAWYFTELQAEHLEASLARFQKLTPHELWQLSVERETIATDFIKSTNLLPIRFEDRLVPDKEFVNDWEAHGFTNSTRRGSRERVQGVLAQRVKFREVYRQLQGQRQQQWEQHGGCSRSLCLLTSQAAVDALLQCTYIPFEEAKAALNNKKRKRSPNGSDGGKPTETVLRDFFCFDDFRDKRELPVEEGKPLWLSLYIEEAPQQQQRQQQQQQQHETPDVASFFTSFTARARQGWQEQQHEQREEQQEQQQRKWICKPSAAAVAWRDEVLQGIKKAEYNARPSVWLSPFRAIEPYRMQMSRFVDDRLLTVVGELRHQLPFLFPLSTADLLLLEGRPASVGERLLPEELPPSSSIDFMLALKQLGTPPEAREAQAGLVRGISPSVPSPPGPPSEKEIARLWSKQYAVCVEISTWTTPLALPLHLMLRRFGCSCFVVINPPMQQQQQQLTREMLEASTPKLGPVLGIEEINVLAAFAAAEPANIFKRKIQESVLPKLPAGGASLVSLDITGVQHSRRQSVEDSERDRETGKPGAGPPRGVVTAVHAELCQAEIEGGLVLLAQLIEGLLVLLPGGDLVLRLHTSYTRYTASLLLLLALCFSSSCLFKSPSVSSWCMDTFFLGRGKRQAESSLVLQLLCAAWNVVVSANRKDAGKEGNSTTSQNVDFFTNNANATQHQAGPHSPAIDCGGVAAEWVLHQCIKAKLFTELVANRWLLSFNNSVLRQQQRELQERLEILAAASRTAGAPGALSDPKARWAAAAALKCLNQQDRKKRIALFLKKQGIMDLVLRKDSPYHLSLSAAKGPRREGEETEDEWGDVSFDAVETLSILAGARLRLNAQAGDAIWTEA